MRLFLTSSGTVFRVRLQQFERSYGYGVLMSSRMRSCKWIGTVFTPSTQVLHSQSAFKVVSYREKMSVRTRVAGFGDHQLIILVTYSLALTGRPAIQEGMESVERSFLPLFFPF